MYIHRRRSVLTLFPLGQSAKEVEVRIGVYGRGAGKWTLLAARKEWERIRDWSREAARDPREAGQERIKDPPRRWTTPYKGS